MACDRNIDHVGQPDPETGTILCRCNECGREERLSCDRDFETGTLIVHVKACDEKRRQQNERALRADKRPAEAAANQGGHP